MDDKYEEVMHEENEAVKNMFKAAAKGSIENWIRQYKEETLKLRKKHIKLPSGLEFDILMPTARQYAFSGLEKAKTDEERAQKVLEMVKLPDGLTLDDLNFEDFIAFSSQVADFFAEMGNLKSPNGFKNTPKG